MHYNLYYDDDWIARIRIDDTDKSHDAIREMVEFWSDWEDRLKAAGGNYTQCWLNQLALQLLYYGPRTENEEGWIPLDGSFGITLVSYVPWSFDSDRVTLTCEADETENEM